MSDAGTWVPVFNLTSVGWGCVFFSVAVACCVVVRSIVASCLQNQRASFSDYAYEPVTNELLLPGAYRGR